MDRTENHRKRAACWTRGD